MSDPKTWLIAFGALAAVGYLSAATALNAFVVAVFYLIAMGVTYAFFQSDGLAKIQELL